MKSLFKTKTAFAQYALATAGAIAAFKPEAVTFINDHAGLVMIVAAGLNLAIRKVTHEKVSLFGADE